MKRSVRAVAVGSLMVVVLSVVGCGQPTRFASLDLSSPEGISKNADNYWKRDSWTWGGMPKDVKKVAITQFAVEYITENVSKSGADALSVLGAMEIGGLGKRKREYPEEFKREFPTPLYEQFVAALKSEGIEVVSREELAKQPGFSALKTGGAGSEYKQGDRSSSAKMQIYPVDGLPLVDDGWFNAGDNLKAEMQMVGDTGAQAGLRVRIRVGLDDDGHAVLGGGSSIHVAYEIKKEEWIKGKPEWVAKQRHSLAGGPALRDDDAVADAKEFKMFQGDVYTVNGPKFRDSVLKMYPAYARMAVVKLKS